MAKILWSVGIDEVSGALSKIKTKSNHKYDMNMFLATHRKAQTVQDCSRAYFRKFNMLPWNTNPHLNGNTLNLRTRFTEVAAMVKSRSRDLMKVTEDQEAFAAILDKATSIAGVKPTMRIFLWLVCGNEYNKTHGGDTYEGEYPTASMVAEVVKRSRARG